MLRGPREAREDGALLSEPGLKSPHLLFWKGLDWRTKTRSVSFKIKVAGEETEPACEGGSVEEGR